MIEAVLTVYRGIDRFAIRCTRREQNFLLAGFYVGVAGTCLAALGGWHLAKTFYVLFPLL